MFRVKLLAALIGLFTLAAVGCTDSSGPTNKTSSSAKSQADGKGTPAAADGSGAK
jgi:hypothetical protein